MADLMKVVVAHAKLRALRSQMVRRNIVVGVDARIMAIARSWVVLRAERRQILLLGNLSFEFRSLTWQQEDLGILKLLLLRFLNPLHVHLDALDLLDRSLLAVGYEDFVDTGGALFEVRLEDEVLVLKGSLLAADLLDLLELFLFPIYQTLVEGVALELLYASIFALSSSQRGQCPRAGGSTPISLH